jgi:hypothetical protein
MKPHLYKRLPFAVFKFGLFTVKVKKRQIKVINLEDCGRNQPCLLQSHNLPNNLPGRAEENKK